MPQSISDGVACAANVGFLSLRRVRLRSPRAALAAEGMLPALADRGLGFSGVGKVHQNSRENREGGLL